jgi:diguanylate cyclase (GGDEF)-like protein/putative nucleotidyltransferase with HDIG domain
MLARPANDRSLRSPRLLLLVFGIFLVLVGMTGSALVAITSSHLADSTLRAVVERDRSLVDLFANGNLTVEDLDGEIDGERRAELVARLDALAGSDQILAVDVRTADSGVVASGGDGSRAQPDEALIAAALEGQANAAVGDAAELVEYLPLVTPDGSVLGVVVLQRDATRVMADVGDAGRDVLVVTVVAAAVLAGILVLVFRAAAQRLGRQQAQLAEAARRDALTGMLNHGSVVGLLAERFESAGDSAAVAVALVDIDNFALFNDTHGHEAGDAVLRRVAELVASASGSEGLAGRYGPDEFVVVRHETTAEGLLALAEELRSEMRAISVRVGDSEELPVTVSIGIAAAPSHAASVTPLLAEASVALGEAQAGGGDRVVVGRIGDDRGLQAGGFDVLQGLVLAVDTKDRYTKRHSEDVARYGVYLARRLGHADLVEPVRIAGLLHDVGKIGIPDRLLRKPSRLTEAEVKAFNQHVALGAAIVQGLPEMELVRAGIRHHHERWDGGGYLDGLAGEAIPLIARIIAVADTFSAMTTTRPYRKALPVEEALRRLREAAGTQLQPELVDAFAAGIESDPAAPMPNETSDVWQPLRVA